MNEWLSMRPEKFTQICETFQLKRNQQKWQTHCCRRGIGFLQLRLTFNSSWVRPFSFVIHLVGEPRVYLYRLVASIDIVSHSHHILRNLNNYRRSRRRKKNENQRLWYTRSNNIKSDTQSTAWSDFPFINSLFLRIAVSVRVVDGIRTFFAERSKAYSNA